MGSLEQSENEPRSFAVEITNSVIGFLAPLYNDDALSQKRIQFLIDHHLKLVKEGLFQTLTKQVETALVSCSTNNSKEGLLENVQSIFDQYQNM